MTAKRKDDAHPLIYTYLKKYQEDPSSRIFAPLAEAYRKAGLIDDAIEIAREGLRVHPRFIGGRVALARALFDKHLYGDVVNELKPVVQDVPDNLVAQRLLADSFLMLGRVAEALDAYKMLFYFSPQDVDLAKMVRELELQAYENGALVLRVEPAEPGSYLPQNEPRQRWIRKVEVLQQLLQRVERYKAHNSLQK